MEQNVKGVLVLIVENADCRGQWLVQRRTKPGEPVVWELPQGKIQTGETLYQACARELLEETGLQLGKMLTPGVAPDDEVSRQAGEGMGAMGRAFVPFAAMLDVPEQELAVCLLAEATGQLVASEEACGQRWCDAATLRQLLQQEPFYPTNRVFLQQFLAHVVPPE